MNVPIAVIARFALFAAACAYVFTALGCSPPPSPSAAQHSATANTPGAGGSADTYAGTDAGFGDFLERYLEAYGSGDIDRLLPFYRDDSLIWANGRETVIGWPRVRGMFEPSFERFAINARINLFEAIELDDRAFLRFVTDVTLTPYDGGEPFTLHFRDFALLAKDPAGQWYIARNIDQPVERTLRDADLAVPVDDDGILKIIEVAVQPVAFTEGE